MLSLFQAILSPTASVQAHGGVIVNTGYTDQYEWLIAISPYPVTPGETILTLLLYDVNTYAPILDIHAELTMTNTEGINLGPVVLETDPEIYPGDYSGILQLDELTNWDGLFQVWQAEEDKGSGLAPLELTFKFEVMEGVREPTATPVVEATETAFAAQVATVRAETPSPTEGDTGVQESDDAVEATPVPTSADVPTETEPVSSPSDSATTATLSSPVTSASGPFGLNWLTLALIAIVPLILVVYWVMK
ncbi:MAG: hypothetical protein AAF639_00250 [Chloroflexota bacterium]